MTRPLDRRRGRGSDRPRAAYPRVARVNSQLAHVIAEAVGRAGETDDRLGMLTVTGVATDRDLRHATVYFAVLGAAAAAALGEHRVGLQSEIGRQVRMKRTPQLRFAADPAVAAGARVEEAIRRIRGGS